MTRRVVPVSLTVISVVLAIAMAVIVYVLIAQAEMLPLGQFGVLALAFPLHFLLVAVLVVLLGLLAWKFRVRIVAGVFGGIALTSIVIAIVPSVAMWRAARAQNVSVSLSNYLQYAFKPNFGVPHRERTVSYGKTADGNDLLLDVWLPDQTPPDGQLRPAMVQVHGGAWVAGSRGSAPLWNRWLNSVGYAVFDIDYRMPPPVRWKDEVGDVKCALGWVVKNATKYQIDPNRISISGHSAGGNLAMLAAYTYSDPELPPSCEVQTVRVYSVVNFYGPSDLTLLYRTSPSPTMVQNAMHRYIDGAPNQFPERFWALSPLQRVSRDSPPTITFLGTSDRVIPSDQAKLLDEALKQNHVESEIYLLPAQDHNFDGNWGSFATQFVRTKVEAFLRP